MSTLTLLMIARIPADGIAGFQDYEARVLPLLAVHGGRLERRLRSADAATEAHLVHFPGRAAFDAFRADPRRAEAAPLLAASRASIEVLELADVDH
jgi:hypothetical protein